MIVKKLLTDSLDYYSCFSLNFPYIYFVVLLHIKTKCTVCPVVNVQIPSTISSTEDTNHEVELKNNSIRNSLN